MSQFSTSSPGAGPKPQPYQPSEGAGIYRLCDLPGDGTWQYRTADHQSWFTWRLSGKQPTMGPFVEARPVPPKAHTVTVELTDEELSARAREPAIHLIAGPYFSAADKYNAACRAALAAEALEEQPPT